MLHLRARKARRDRIPKKPRSDDKESDVEKSRGTEQAGPTEDLESMSASMRKKSPKTKIPKSKKSKEKQEDST